MQVNLEELSINDTIFKLKIITANLKKRNNGRKYIALKVFA